MAAAPSRAAASLINGEPHDTKRAVRQVALRFSEDMVALGDDQAPDPATLSCVGTDLRAKGHWLDPRRWIAEFPEALPDGVRCEVQPHSLISLKGNAMAAAPSWRFDTGGPRILETLKISGELGAKETPIFAFLPSASLDHGSLSNLQCTVDGEPSAITVLGGETRIAFLKQRLRDRKDEYKKDWLVVRCGQADWPSDARVEFIWGRNIASFSGVVNQQDVKIPIEVRPALQAVLTCTTLLDAEGCDPRQDLFINRSYRGMPDKLTRLLVEQAYSRLPGIAVNFTEFIACQAADDITLEGSSGTVYRPVWQSKPRPDSLVRQVSFPYDFSREERVLLRLPANLVDVDGRKLADHPNRERELSFAPAPAYLGMPRTGGVLKWHPGQSAEWPIATRHLEPTLKVKAWNFSGDSSTDTLIRLQKLVRSREPAAAPKASELTQAFATSDKLIASFANAPQQQEFAVDTQAGDAAFSSLKLSGYGTWLIEADSPAYRAVLERQRKALVGSGKVDDERPGSLYFNVVQRWINSRIAIVELTNLHVDYLSSRSGDSLVWVTALDTGLPVAQADVQFHAPNGALLWQGKTDDAGRATVPSTVKRAMQRHTWHRINDHWIVVRHGADALTMPAAEQYQVADDGPVMHTVLDRVLFEPGETVSLETVMRLQGNRGISKPEDGRVLKVDISSDSARHAVFETQITLSQGSAQTSWTIPASADLGWYVGHVKDDKTGQTDQFWFQVEEFRRPLFDSGLTLHPTWQGNSTKLHITPHLAFTGGGAPVGQEITIKGKYQIGRALPRSSFEFGDNSAKEEELPLFPELHGKINAHGVADLTATVPSTDFALRLRAEMHYTDPSGETLSESQDIDLWPQKPKLGMKLETVRDDTNAVNVALIALDRHDHALPGQHIALQLISPDKKATRLCAIETDAQGGASCLWRDGRIRKLEGWTLAATANGMWAAKLRASQATNLYDPAKSRPWLIRLASAEPPRIGAPLLMTIRAPFLPATALVTVEREGILASVVRTMTNEEETVEFATPASFAPGATVTVHFMQGEAAQPVPGRNSNALTESDTQELLFDKSANLLDVELRLPQDTVKPGATVPLAIKVNNPDGSAAALAKVTLIAVDDSLLALKENNSWNILRAFWRSSGTDTDTISANGSWYLGRLFRDAAGFVPAEEIALSRLQRGHGWMKTIMADDIGAMPDKNLADALSHVPGVTISAGGAVEGGYDDHGLEEPHRDHHDGSGATALRNNFSSLALWRADLTLDQNGVAQIPVTLGDSLTRWRIEAIATAGSDRFGTGSTSITTDQPAQILSGMPQLLRGDDKVRQKLTLRNRGKLPLELVLTADAQHVPTNDLMARSAVMTASMRKTHGLAFERKLHLAPGENRAVQWIVAVPDTARALNWVFTLRDKNGKTLDAIAASQIVVPAVPVTVRESTLLTIDQDRTLVLAQASGARPGKGGVQVKWQNSLVDAAVDGARYWMERYPNTCMEQLSSRAAVSADSARWQTIVERLQGMLDGHGLVRYFPETPGSAVLTAYLLDLTKVYRLDLPLDLRNAMQDALREQLQSEEKAASASATATSVTALSLRLALQAAVAPDLGKARPVVPDELEELPTAALLDWVRYLITQPATTAQRAQLDAASAALRDRFDMQGTRLSLRHDPRDNNAWTMSNVETVEAQAALLVQRNLAAEPRWQGLMPGLIANLAGRQREGHWSTTVANAWAVAAMRDFAALSEQHKVAGVSMARMGGSERRAEWPQPVMGVFPWSVSGPHSSLQLHHEGSGTPWATVQVLAAVNPPEPVAHGLSIAKSIEAVQQKTGGVWSEGDIVRVRLSLQADAVLDWLAIRDPIPSGASLLGKGLKKESALTVDGGHVPTSPHYAPDSVELGNENYRAYFQHVERGKWEVTYLLRLNNAGSFNLPATRAEAMYAPEIFAESPNAPLLVQP